MRTNKNMLSWQSSVYTQKMKPLFFPKSQLFWACHLGVIILSLGFRVLLALTYDGSLSATIKYMLVWAIEFTIVILFFRKLYIEKQWSNLSTEKFIVFSITFSGIAGLLMSVLVILTLRIIDGPDYFVRMINEYPGVSLIQQLIANLTGSTLYAQLYFSGWIFLYTFITKSRQTKEVELVNLKLQNNLKEAKLISLSNQLNPHFLFNSLNNIRFSMYEDILQADEMITSLSDILRYSLESSKQDKVLLSQELEIINQYLIIVRAQLEGRLSCTINIPQEFYSCLVPPMVLQMLAENAIKHGLDNISEGGRLSLSAQELDKHLIFTVINDVPQAQPKASLSTGIGLNNIAQRLQLLYADNASLSISQSMNEFTVIITLPKEFVA
jgi:sensor histidine kinase YesM